MECTNQRGARNKETAKEFGILIVDDDINSLEMLKLYFEIEGFKVSCAANGYEALVLLKSWPFSLMLTDYNMPGMDGLKLSEEAKKNYPQLKIVMITGDSLKKLNSRAAQLGIIAVLHKPLNMKELFSKVRVATELLQATSDTVSQYPLSLGNNPSIF